jgi:hypothetical protein
MTALQELSGLPYAPGRGAGGAPTWKRVPAASTAGQLPASNDLSVRLGMKHVLNLGLVLNQGFSLVDAERQYIFRS